MCHPPLKLLYDLMPGRMDPALDIFYDMTLVVDKLQDTQVGLEPTYVMRK